MTRELAQLLVGSLALWGLLALPAWLVGGDTALFDTVIACGLCLAPMILTMIWCQRALGGAPEQQLAATLGSTGTRLVVVLGGAIGLFQTVESLHRPSFMIWVVLFYICTLALETTLIVRRQNAILGAAKPGDASVSG